MLQKLETNSADILALEAIGKITKEDYIQVLEPEFERYAQAEKPFRFLIHLGPQFEGYTAGAAWEDLKVGIKFSGRIERCAIVSDLKSVNTMSTFFGGFVPCTVQAFRDEELHDALAWLDSGEIALDYHLDSTRGILRVEIKAPITSLLFSTLTSVVDAYIEKNGDLNGVLIHVQDFPGWEDFGSLLSHLKFIKDHHRHIKKIAAVTSGVPKMLPTLANHFVKAEVKLFGPAESQEATAWLVE